MKFINNLFFPLKQEPFFDGIIYGHFQHQVLFAANPCFSSLSPSATLLTFSLSFMLGGCSQLWSCTLNVISKPQSPPCHGPVSRRSCKAREGTEIEGKKTPKTRQNTKMMSSDLQLRPLISPVTGEHHLRVTIIIQTPYMKCCELLRREKN